MNSRANFWQFSLPKLYFGLASFHRWMNSWFGCGYRGSGELRVRGRARVRVGVGVGAWARSHLNLVVSLRRGTDVSEPADIGTDLRLLPMGHGHVHLRRILLLNGRTRGELGGFGGNGFGRPRQWLGAASARPACAGDCRTGQSHAEEARKQGVWEEGTLTMLSPPCSHPRPRTRCRRPGPPSASRRARSR